MNASTLLAALLSATPPATASPAPQPAATQPGPPALELRAPLFDAGFAQTPVAAVDGERIPMAELTELLEETHSSATMGGQKKQDLARLVDRLVSLRIISAEAKGMGLHELPEVAKPLADKRGTTRRAIVKERATASVKADPAQVEAIFRSKVVEWRIDSVIFKAPEDAKAFHAAVLAGKDWKKLSDEAIASGKATSGELPDYVPPSKVLPGIRDAMEGLKPGEVAKTPFQTSQGFAVVRLLDERFPENDEARSEAEELARGAAVDVQMSNVYDALTKKLARVDRKLLASADFDSAKKFKARRTDARVLAAVQGGEPIRVKDLADAMEKQFFHGVERSADKKELNSKKQQFFDGLLFHRLLDREADLQKVDESPEFLARYGAFERSMLFQIFVQRVLLGGIVVKEEEARARYDANKAAFATPPMVRLEAVAYTDAKSARAALEKAQRGAEFSWLVENTENQVPAEERNLQIDGRPVVVSRLPAGLAKTLANAHEGDYRLHVEAEQSWIVHVSGEIPSAVRSFDEVKKDIVNALYGEKLDAALREYVDKLRSSHRIEIYATRFAS